MLSTQLVHPHMMSRSIFGSVRDKLSRRSTSSSQAPGDRDRDRKPSRPSNPFLDTPASSQGCAVNDVPPAYTPNSESVPSASAPNSGFAQGPVDIVNVSTKDDQFAFLASFDTIFLIDDSTSMTGSSWREVKEAIRAITPICTAHDADGIDVYFLNHRSNQSGGPFKADHGYYNVTSTSMVESLFSRVKPQGVTPTGTRLLSILRPYVTALENNRNQMEKIKPVNIIVITDGAPTDDPEGTIVQQAKKLDHLEAPPYQVGIQFFQVGNLSGASQALKELDDDLSQQGIRDMVDTVTWNSTGSARNKTLTADGILKVVLGAVVRRLDRRDAHGRKG